jgi:hypothetical protein
LKQSAGLCSSIIYIVLNKTRAASGGVRSAARRLSIVIVQLLLICYEPHGDGGERL